MKRTAFVGQAMPRMKRDPHDWPGLNEWMYSIGITDSDIGNNFLYTALVGYFPGSKGSSHIVPGESEIEKERNRLQVELVQFDPQMVVTVGKLSVCKCLGKDVDKLSDVVGKKFQIDPYNMLGREVVVIPLPHPSGVSTWRYHKKNKRLLNRALTHLKLEL